MKKFLFTLGLMLFSTASWAQLTLLSQPTGANVSSVVNLTTGSFPSPYANIQAALDAFPAGTTFVFAAGSYRYTTTGDTALNPPIGAVLQGPAPIVGIPSVPPQAVFNGALVLGSWTQ